MNLPGSRAAQVSSKPDQKTIRGEPHRSARPPTHTHCTHAPAAGCGLSRRGQSRHAGKNAARRAPLGRAPDLVPVAVPAAHAAHACRAPRRARVSPVDTRPRRSGPSRAGRQSACAFFLLAAPGRALGPDPRPGAARAGRTAHALDTDARRHGATDVARPRPRSRPLPAAARPLRASVLPSPLSLSLPSDSAPLGPGADGGLSAALSGRRVRGRRGGGAVRDRTPPQARGRAVVLVAVWGDLVRATRLAGRAPRPIHRAGGGRAGDLGGGGGVKGEPPQASLRAIYSRL